MPGGSPNFRIHEVRCGEEDRGLQEPRWRYRAVHALTTRCALLFVLLAGCASAPPQGPLRSLDPSVNDHTVYSLTYFAVKNRICGDIRERELEEDIARFFRDNPEAQIYPAMHGTGDQYADCVHNKPVSLCDATAEDFRSVRVVMTQDPRLEAFLSFEQLLAERNRQCPPDASIDEQARRQHRVRLDPLACKKDQDWYRSPLVEMARMMRVRNPSYGTEGYFCRNNAGYEFLRSHCRDSLQGRRRQLARRHFWLPVQLGIEAYLCPLAEPDFNLQR
jgi:hypothetical protein